MKTKTNIILGGLFFTIIALSYFGFKWLKKKAGEQALKENYN